MNENELLAALDANPRAFGAAIVLTACKMGLVTSEDLTAISEKAKSFGPASDAAAAACIFGLIASRCAEGIKALMVDATTQQPTPAAPA